MPTTGKSASQERNQSKSQEEKNGEMKQVEALVEKKQKSSIRSSSVP